MTVIRVEGKDIEIDCQDYECEECRFLDISGLPFCKKFKIKIESKLYPLDNTLHRWTFFRCQACKDAEIKDKNVTKC